MPFQKLSNVINDSIMKGIAVAIDNECYGSSVILIYAGIDAMAYLGLPESQENVSNKDFINWVDRYIRFNGEVQLSGVELYSARCGMLHTYSPFSKLTREGRARVIGYVDEASIEVMVDNEVPDLVIVSIKALAQAFSRGVQAFVDEIYTSKERIDSVSERLGSVIQTSDLPPEFRRL